MSFAPKVVRDRRRRLPTRQNPMSRLPLYTVRATSLVGLALPILIMAACDDDLVGPGWGDRLLAASGAPPSQEEWTAIRPYRFAHDTLTIRVGQRIPIARPCEPRPGRTCSPTPSDTAAVATWTKHLALTTCARNPAPECRTDTQPTWVWLGDPPPWVPWTEAVDSGFVAVTDRATLESLADVVPRCLGSIESVPSGGVKLGVQGCLLITVSRSSHGGAVDESCLPPDLPEFGFCYPGYIGREPGWGWFESTMRGGTGNPLFTDTVAVRVLP